MTGAAPGNVVVERVDPSQLGAGLSLEVAGFWLLGGLILAGAIFTISRRNPVSAVISLVATFFGLAAVYAMLSAHFLAALQVLVYAGAIMVLFIFVVMVLNRDDVDPWVFRGWLGKVFVGVPAIAYLVFRLARTLSQVVATHPEAPPPEFGSVASVGQVLFSEHLFAFEAVSVVLLVAVIGAVVVARTPKQTHDLALPEPPSSGSEDAVEAHDAPAAGPGHGHGHGAHA